MIDLRLLRLTSLIIHRVPRKAAVGGGPTQPTLSETTTPDRADVQAFFARRVRAAVEMRGLPIEPDPTRDQAAADAIGAMLDDPAALTSRSRDLGTRLFDVQDQRNTPGLLVAGTGTLGPRVAVAIMKLEHDSGIRAEEARVDGQLTFEVVVHDDLLLTPHTQLFKGAVFARDPKGDIEALGADMQVGGGIAAFFLEDFLGFRLHETPAVATERFLDASERWLAQLPDPEKQARYEIALLAQLQSAQASVSVPNFADNNIDADDYQSYRQFVTGQGVRWSTLRKDVSGIESRIKRVAYAFESGIKIVGRREAVEQHVAVETLDEGRARVVVEDELTRVHSHG